MVWLLSFALATATAAPPLKTYLGHQVVWGQVPVPLRGDVDIRTDTWMLVDMQVDEDGAVSWTQRDCKISMSPVMGIETSFADGAVQRLPPSKARLTRTPKGTLAGQWQSTWTQADHDGDGNPGVTIYVDMPLCGGRIYITMTNRTEASAAWVGDELLGEVKSAMERRTLGTSNWCLGLGPKRVDQTMHGVFLMQPAKGAVTCDTLQKQDWPNALRDSEAGEKK